MGYKYNPLLFSGFDLTGSSAGMTIGGPVAGSTPYAILSVDGSSNLDEIGPLTDGQLIIGVTGGASVPASLTGTANQLIVTNGAGSITLSLPQSIATSSNPSFNSLSLTAASNQLILSTAANGLTINSGTSAAARTYTVPDVGTTGTFMMLQGAQTVTGVKTFSSAILANGTIDVTATGGTDTLNIGIANADVINIGRSGATINIQGDTFYQNVTNLQVADKLFTVNVGGSVASGSDSGFEIEENALITGYVKTSADRNSFVLKAPNTAGEVTLTPGVSGITINQSSHNPVTIGSFGSSPNANGLSLSTQVLTLQPADATNPGALSAGTQSIGGNKTFTGNVNINGTTTLNTGLTGPLKSSSGVISASAINLTSEVTGTLPIANGGTNSSSALTNGKLMSSVAGAIVESAINTADVVLLVAEGSFSAANNQSSPTNITGLAFANASIRSFQTVISIFIDATSDLFAQYQLNGIQKGSSWEMSQEFVGDDTGIEFSITNAGQVQYISTNVSGFVSDTMKFKSLTTSV